MEVWFPNILLKPLERKAAIKEELLKYCELDTYAMIKLWQFFAGRNDLLI
jgi:hypothetical protein